jgi:urea carboxylase-associated protein 2
LTTATPKGAQQHARSQADTIVETMPLLPASTVATRPEGVDAAQLTWAETIAGGGYGSVQLQVGDTLELTDRYGDACAHLLVYNAAQPAERLNVADTIKVQWQAYLSTGSVLLSDLGRALATITADTSQRHDTLCGASSLLANTARYGDGSPQGVAPAGRELFKLAAAKHGLEARDIPPSVSFFQGVRANLDGTISFIGSAGAGTAVRLIAELPILVLIANTAHPIDPRPDYTCSPVTVTAWRGGAAYSDKRSPEMTRAMLNTQAYLTMRGNATGAA